VPTATTRTIELCENCKKSFFGQWNTSVLEFFTIFNNKSKALDHEGSLAFCLPTREWRRRGRVRSQGQLLVQMNLGKIEKIRFS